jgi:SPP1 gp7 family putative phage head morphogenesis protein
MPENLPEIKASNGVNLINQEYTGIAEQTYFKSPMVQESYMAPYNQDDLWQKTGDYSIYQEMLKDDQISVCLQLKKDLILGAGFDIISSESSQKDMAKEIDSILTNETECPFSGYIEEVLSAYEFGFSISEKIFKLTDDNRLAVKALKTRHPNSWLLYQDDFGNVTKYEQNSVKGNIDVNPKALIHFINNQKFQNPYGQSDLRTAYAAWFTKRQVVRYYGIFLEKGCSPIPVGKYDAKSPPGTAAEILDILKKFQTKTALSLPKNIDVEFLEAKSTGEAYEKAINIFNMFIGRALFIPDLLGLTGGESGGGSYSLGKEQMKLFFMHINRRRAAIEYVINKQIILPIVQYNYGLLENYPKFKFKPLDDNDAVEFAKVWLDAVKGKVFKANEEEVNYFRSLVKFPEGEVEFENPQTSAQYPSGQNAQGQGQAEYEESEEEDESLIEAEAEGDGDDEETGEEAKEFKLGKLPPGEYHRKVNFKAIKTKLSDYDESIKNETAPIVKKIFSDLLDQIQQKKIIQSGNLDRIETLKLKYLKELKQVLKTSFLALYKDSQTQAAQELFKSNFASPITDDKFLDIIEKETFQYVGDYEYMITKEAKKKLIAAIKDGEPLSNVIDVLSVDAKKLSDTSIDRFARTKHTEVMNKGRFEFFDNSGVVQAYQYSAILDDVTSSICRTLDGKIFTPENCPIPPMHFNCRSLLIPITKYETARITQKIGGKDPSDWIKENASSGFAIK